MKLFQSCRICAMLGLLQFSCCFLQAQQKDFQNWTSAEAGLEVLKNLNVNFAEEIRFKENCSQLDRQFNDLGIAFKFSKYLRASVYYRIQATWDHPGQYNWKQSFYGDLSFKYTTGRFLFGYRARFQSARVDFKDKQDRLLNELVNRHRLLAEYNIKNLPVTPFAEGELFFLLHNQQNNISNCRGWIGLTYSPGKIHEFSLKYGFDHEINQADPVTLYIIALNYSVNLKL